MAFKEKVKMLLIKNKFYKIIIYNYKKIILIKKLNEIIKNKLNYGNNKCIIKIIYKKININNINIKVFLNKLK